MKKQYCVDSSAFIQAKHIRYPMDNFPSVWEKFDELIKNGTFIIPRLVYDEVTTGEDDLGKWMKKHNKLVIPVDIQLITETTRITNLYPILDPNATREIADPYVVALAKLRDIPCVHEEVLGSEQRRQWKIPNVCAKENVISLNLVETIKELGLKF
ncbi:MAG: DUF4411 family protein [Pseudobdellovibrionaceae bacterium]